MARLYDTGGRILWSSPAPGIAEALADAALRAADLRRLRLSDVALEGHSLAYFTLDGAVFTNVRFHNVDLQHASLVDARFNDCHFDHVNLQRADMTRSVVTSASGGVDMEHSVLYGTGLSLAHLADLHIRDTSMHHADLSGADLSRTFLERCDLTEAEMYQVETTDETGDRVRTPTNLTAARLDRVNLDSIWAYDPIVERIDVVDVSLQGATILGADFPLPGQGPVSRRGELERAIIGTVVGPWPIEAWSGKFDGETARVAERDMRAMRRGVAALLRSSPREIASSVATVGREVLDLYALESGGRLEHNERAPHPSQFASDLLSPERGVAGCELSADAMLSLDHLAEYFASHRREASTATSQSAEERPVPSPTLGL